MTSSDGPARGGECPEDVRSDVWQSQHSCHEQRSEPADPLQVLREQEGETDHPYTGDQQGGQGCSDPPV